MGASNSTIRISFERETNGGDYVFITSQDLPGFNLWGPPKKVYPDIIPTIKKMYKKNEGIDVDVVAKDNPENWPGKSAGNSKNTIDFVITRKAA